MSHATGTVYSTDRSTILGYFEYNGTCDVACTAIQKTQEALNENWRGPGCMKECSCGKEPTDVVLHSDYGSGFHWDSKACLECMAICGHLDKWAQQREDDLANKWPW